MHGYSEPYAMLLAQRIMDAGKRANFSTMPVISKRSLGNIYGWFSLTCAWSVPGFALTFGDALVVLRLCDRFL